MTRALWALAAGALVAGILVGVIRCEAIEERIYQAGVMVERELAGLEAGVHDTGQERIAYLARPGEIEVVLIHGFASQKDIWLQLVQELPDEIGVLAIDLPGHGDSTAEPGRDYSADSLADAVIRVIEQRFDGRAVPISGSSLGGAVAFLVAARRPDLVESLVQFNPAGAPGALSPELQAAGDSPDNPLIVTSRSDFDRMLDRVFFDPPILPWPAARVLTRMHIERVELHREIWRDLATAESSPERLFAAIEAPVLVVWGREDRVLHASAVDYFARHIRRFEVEWLDDAGHAPIVELPERTASLLAARVAGVEQPR